MATKSASKNDEIGSTPADSVAATQIISWLLWQHDQVKKIWTRYLESIKCSILL